MGGGIEQTRIGRDHTNQLGALGAREVACVRDLAAKVEAAGKGEDVREVTV